MSNLTKTDLILSKYFIQLPLSLKITLLLMDGEPHIGLSTLKYLTYQN